MFYSSSNQNLHVSKVMQNQSKKSMLLRLLFFAVLLNITYTCPDSALIQPCTCERRKWPIEARLNITCESVEVNHVRTVLRYVDKTDVYVWINLKGISLDDGVLPAGLFLGLHDKRISIRHSNLSSVDERAFADQVAANLTTIILDSNDLERVPIEALQRTPNLEYLSLNYNRLEVLHAGSFKGLHSLYLLELEGNRMKIIEDSAFSGMSNDLSMLFLQHNELTSFPSRPLRNFSSIRYLFLGNNKISDLQPDEIAVMNGCAFNGIYLINNRIRQLLPRTFESQKELGGLDLDKNEVEFVHPQAFQGIEDKLHTLSLNDNKLDEIPAASLRAMRKMTRLYLLGNNISTIRKDDFLAYGKNLRDVYLNNNSLTSVDPMAFVPLESVKVLRLEWNQLRSLPHRTYAPVVDTLLTFIVNGNPLHCDCEIAWFRDWMEGDGRRVVDDDPQEIKCTSPEEFMGISLQKIPRYQLDFHYGDSTQINSSCPVSNAASSSRVDSGALIIWFVFIACFYIPVSSWSKFPTAFHRK